MAGGLQLRAQGQAGAAPPAPAPVAPADIAGLRAESEQWRLDFKTWGQWGTGDNKGASNLITPEKVLSATSLVKSGIVVSLAPPVPQVAAADVNENGIAQLKGVERVDPMPTRFRGDMSGCRPFWPRLQHRLESETGLGGDAQCDPCRGAQLDGYLLSWRASTSNRPSPRRGNSTRYEFLITFAPLPVEGSTGSPLNPLAIF